MHLYFSVVLTWNSSKLSVTQSGVNYSFKVKTLKVIKNVRETRCFCDISHSFPIICGGIFKLSRTYTIDLFYEN